MKFQIILFIFITFFIKIAFSQVAVIAHKSAPIDEISVSQLLDFYTGEEKFWDDEIPVIVFDLESKGEIKKTFYKYLGKSTSRMKSIWMKRMLLGEGDPPESVISEEKILEKVAKIKGSVGFINYSKVTPEVKVLALIEIKKE